MAYQSMIVIIPSLNFEFDMKEATLFLILFFVMIARGNASECTGSNPECSAC
jgi:hypothetical protein